MKKYILTTSCLFLSLGLLMSLAPAEKVGNEISDKDSEVQALLNEYYNSGVYVKDSIINLSNGVKEEVSEYFHAKVTILERTTYYKGNELWMSRGNGEYSYYGSAPNNGGVTNATASEALVTPENPKVVLSGEGKESMDAYYVTLTDIKDSTGWEETDGVYTNTSAEVIDMFVNFTAPLWIGKTEENANYIDFSKATVEEIDDKLVLRLYVDSDDSGKVNNKDLIFSQATISYEGKEPTQPSDQTKMPTIELEEQEITIDIGDPLFIGEYVVAKDYEGKNINHKVEYSADPGVTELEGQFVFANSGTYNIVYSVEDYGNEVSVTLKVNVVGDITQVDTHKPVFTGVKTTVNSLPNREIDLLEGIKVYDDIDGDITSQVKIYLNNELYSGTKYTYTTTEKNVEEELNIKLECTDSSNNRSEVTYKLVISSSIQEYHSLTDKIAKEYNCTITNETTNQYPNLPTKKIEGDAGKYANAIVPTLMYEPSLVGKAISFKFKTSNIKDDVFALAFMKEGEKIESITCSKTIALGGVIVNSLGNEWYEMTVVMDNVLEDCLDTNPDLVVDNIRISFTNASSGSSIMYISDMRLFDCDKVSFEAPMNPNRDYAVEVKTTYNDPVITYSTDVISPNKNSTYSALVTIPTLGNGSITYAGVRVDLGTADLTNKILAYDVYYETSPNSGAIRLSWDGEFIEFTVSESTNIPGIEITRVNEKWLHVEIDLDQMPENVKHKEAAFVLFQFTNASNSNKEAKVYLDNINFLSKDPEYVYQGTVADGEGEMPTTPLAAPVISLNSETQVLTWSEVENATGYEVYLNNQLVKTITTTSYTFDLTEDGIYSISVKAITTNPHFSSSTSNTVKHVIGDIKSEDFDLTNQFVAKSAHITQSSETYDGEHSILITEDTAYQSIAIDLSEYGDLSKYKIVFYAKAGEGYKKGYTKLGFTLYTGMDLKTKVGSEQALYFPFTASHAPVLGNAEQVEGSSWWRAEFNIRDINADCTGATVLRLKLSDENVCSMYIDSMTIEEI